MTAIPAKPSGDIVGDFGGEVLSATLHFVLGNVKEQTPPRTIGLTEVPLPIETTQILRPERDRQLEVDRDRDLSSDEIQLAAGQCFGHLGDQPLR